MQNKEKWPTLSVSDFDRDLIGEIRKANGVLKSIDQKNLLLIAAAIALKYDLREDPDKHTGSNDVIHASYLNSNEYNEYRQYILLIYYFTKANKNLSVMNNLNDITKNFIDYAHRGLLYLKMIYLDGDNGDAAIMKEYGKYLSLNKPER